MRIKGISLQIDIDNSNDLIKNEAIADGVIYEVVYFLEQKGYKVIKDKNSICAPKLFIHKIAD